MHLFADEEFMRSQGYDKTPDFKIHVPFGQIIISLLSVNYYYVTLHDVAVSGTVINWIESKALFANEISHKKYCEDQLQSYYNRYTKESICFT